MNGYRLLQVAGAALAVVTMLLMMRGTYDQGQYLQGSGKVVFQ